LDEKRTTFFVARCHFMVMNQQVEGSAAYGEKLGEFLSEGATQEITDAIEYQYTVSYTDETLRSSLRENSSVHSFVSSLAGETAVAPHKLSQNTQLELSHKLREEFQTSFKVVNSVTTQTSFKHEAKITLPGTFQEPHVYPAVYQRWVGHLFLTHIEYLRVRYLRSFFGLRRKRTKFPPLPMNPTDTRANVHRCHLPLSAIYYWKRLPKSSVLIPATKYKIEVVNPDECEIRPPEDKREYYAPVPSKPTLYQLSNLAFPLKWIKRPGNGEWTEEQLRRIEEDEQRETAIGRLRERGVDKR
jgi:hypothetical protein